MKHKPTTKLATPTTIAPIALGESELTGAAGAGGWNLYAQVQDFVHGLAEGYAYWDRDQDIQYGGPDGMDPPNA